MDYKNYEEGKYPEPKDRKFAKHFPEKEELFVYGEDVPVPTSVTELRGNYNEDEKNPLVLADLEGYKVPPLGLGTVGVNGSGFQPGGGWIYPAGTFRENKYAIDAEFGVSRKELIAARERKIKEAQTDAVIAFLQEKLGDEASYLDASKFNDERAVEGLLLWSLRMIDDKQAAREAVRITEWYVKQQAHKDEVIKRHEENEMTFEQALEFVKKVKDTKILDNPVDITVVEGEIEDIEE